MPTAEELLALKVAEAIWEHDRKIALEENGDDNGAWFEPNYDPDALFLSEMEEHFLRDRVLQQARVALRSIASDLPTMLAEERAEGREEAARGVWTVCEGEPNEGNADPEFVFFSEDDANAFAAELKAKRGNDQVDVLRLRSRDPRAGGEGGPR